MKAVINTEQSHTTNTNALAGSDRDGSSIHLVKKPELAKRLSVCTRQIDEWVANRIIPFIQTGPHCIRYDVADVVAELKRNYQVNPRERK